jgi:3-phenylpropionate/cinnamic acid dioxygenase small subunit
VSSRAEIAALIHAYAEAVDAADYDAIAAMFAGATYEVPTPDGYVVQRDAQIADAMRHTTIRHDGSPCTKHQITNLVIDLEESAGTASARSYFAVLQAVPGLVPLQTILAGRYHDRFALVDGRWRFAQRIVLTDLAGELTHHVRGVRLTET